MYFGEGMAGRFQALQDSNTGFRDLPDRVAFRRGGAVLGVFSGAFLFSVFSVALADSVPPPAPPRMIPESYERLSPDMVEGGEIVIPEDFGTPGRCGPASRMLHVSTPSSGLCDQGSATSVSGSGPWSWICQSPGGGPDVTCNASMATIPPARPADGVCDPATQGQSFSTPPSSDLCSSGTPTPVADTGSFYRWTCQGDPGGSDMDCSAIDATTPPGMICSAEGRTLSPGDLVGREEAPNLMEISPNGPSVSLPDGADGQQVLRSGSCTACYSRQEDGPLCESMSPGIRREPGSPGYYEYSGTWRIRADCSTSGWDVEVLQTCYAKDESGTR